MSEVFSSGGYSFSVTDVGAAQAEAALSSYYQSLSARGVAVPAGLDALPFASRPGIFWPEAGLTFLADTAARDATSRAGTVNAAATCQLHADLLAEINRVLVAVNLAITDCSISVTATQNIQFGLGGLAAGSSVGTTIDLSLRLAAKASATTSVQRSCAMPTYRLARVMGVVPVLVPIPFILDLDVDASCRAALAAGIAASGSGVLHGRYGLSTTWTGSGWTTTPISEMTSSWAIEQSGVATKFDANGVLGLTATLRMGLSATIGGGPYGNGLVASVPLGITADTGLVGEVNLLGPPSPFAGQLDARLFNIYEDVNAWTQPSLTLVGRTLKAPEKLQAPLYYVRLLGLPVGTIEQKSASSSTASYELKEPLELPRGAIANNISPAITWKLAIPTGFSLTAAGASAAVTGPVTSTAETIYVAYRGTTTSVLQQVASKPIGPMAAPIIITIAGIGVNGFSGDGGPAKNAKISWVYGLAPAHDGSLYIADSGNGRVRKIAVDGLISTIAGTGVYGHSGDGGMAVDAQLANPGGMFLNGDGSLFIAESSGVGVRKVAPGGKITTVVGFDYFIAENMAACAQLGYPKGIGNGDGPAICGNVQSPLALASDQRGNYYATEGGGTLIRKIDSAGMMTTVQNVYSNNSEGIAVDRDGNLFVSSVYSDKIDKVTPSGIRTVYAGTPGSPGSSGDGGPATNARLWRPSGIALDRAGNLYIADKLNNRIRRVGLDGIITTIAGNRGGYSGDGGPATTASLYWPTAVAIDDEGNLLIADMGNYRIRKVTGLQ